MLYMNSYSFQKYFGLQYANDIDFLLTNRRLTEEAGVFVDELRPELDWGRPNIQL